MSTSGIRVDARQCRAASLRTLSSTAWNVVPACLRRRLRVRRCRSSLCAPRSLEASPRSNSIRSARRRSWTRLRRLVALTCASIIAERVGSAEGTRCASTDAGKRTSVKSASKRRYRGTARPVRCRVGRPAVRQHEFVGQPVRRRQLAHRAQHDGQHPSVMLLDPHRVRVASREAKDRPFALREQEHDIAAAVRMMVDHKGPQRVADGRRAARQFPDRAQLLQSGELADEQAEVCATGEFGRGLQQPCDGGEGHPPVGPVQRIRRQAFGRKHRGRVDNELSQQRRHDGHRSDTLAVRIGEEFLNRRRVGIRSSIRQRSSTCTRSAS
jgi:hypothetical protein